MKQIPNLFTLLNLFFGCIAIVLIIQSGLAPYYEVGGVDSVRPDFNIFGGVGSIRPYFDPYGNQYVGMLEKTWVASFFIALAAIVDFLDGFVARILKVPSELGKQLDSLADVVSFGVAPGLIVYQFLRQSYAQQADGLDINILWLLPAFILPCAGAYRLARFNIDTTQSNGFKGVPIPAAGLLFASFPLIYWYSNNDFIIRVLLNKWFWYAAILAVSYLMVSTMPMLAMKFTGVNLKKLMPFLILALISLISALSFGWLAVPVTFIAYVILSLTFKQPES